MNDELENKAANRNELLQQNPDLIEFKDLNNFFDKCPGGTLREFILQQISIGELTRSIHEEYVAGGFSIIDKSDTYLAATYIEFFMAIDEAITEAGLRLKDIQEQVQMYILLTRKGAQEELPLRIQAFDTIRKILVPVYKILRQKGYNHLELIA